MISCEDVHCLYSHHHPVLFGVGRDERRMDNPMGSDCEDRRSCYDRHSFMRAVRDLIATT